LRSLIAGSDGGAYLGDAATRSHPLARIRGTGPALPVSRSVIWGLARQRGFDPVRWHLSGAELVTWGGETYNTLLGALFARQLPEWRFAVTPDRVAGPVHLLDVSLDFIRELARSAEEAGDLPLSTATKFTSASRYLNELSPRLAALEKRSSIPWKPLCRWLDLIQAIERIGSIPARGAAQELDAP
jgi:hypothetical protein